MKATTISVGQTNMVLGMITQTLADFSDADFLTRPCPGANHVMWQVGHLIASTTRMFQAAFPGSMPELPAGFEEKFKKETSTRDDASFFPARAAIMDLFTKTIKAAVAKVETLSETDLAKPGPEPMRKMIPTVADLVGILPAHLSMHLGQFQVARRKLGKPILF